MLRVALPNKGSLAEGAAAMLREAGYRQRSDARALAAVDPDNGVEFFYLRPRDIAVYVGEGTLDVGITGRDLVSDSDAPVRELMELGFGTATFAFAAPDGRYAELEDLAGARVATAYPGMLGRYLAARGVDARIVPLDGAVENAVRLGVADAIADVVSTGATLRAAGLARFGEPIMRSEAVIVARSDFADRPAGGGDPLAVFLRRLQGVLVARRYVMVDYDVPADRVDAACAITPGIESPTVSPLQREGWYAVRALVERAEAQSVMDRLFDLGARGILVTALHACRI